MSQVYIDTSIYKRACTLFEDLPDGLIIVVECDAHDDWYIDSIQGKNPITQRWITFAEEWLGVDLEEVFTKNATDAIERALSDYRAEWGDLAADMAKGG